MSTKKSNLLSKKVILVVAILAGSGMSIILVASSIDSANNCTATTAPEKEDEGAVGRSDTADKWLCEHSERDK